MRLTGLALAFFAGLGLAQNWISTGSISEDTTPQSTASSSLGPDENTSLEAVATIEIQVGNLSGSGVIDFAVTSKSRDFNSFTPIPFPIISDRPRQTVSRHSLCTTVPSLNFTAIGSSTVKFNAFNSTLGSIASHSFLPAQPTGLYYFPNVGTVPGIPDVLVLLSAVIPVLLPTFF
ncbi:hypothetical protein K432DRAFT_408240 [Lepidopterella palustris CBS 459.81]|uniref:Uncharacterized protein n=1 Tax=Lepidopterella palustris CBS 459.81 TaxID=1314670 RepID=A0A8E2E2V6_9PEZI|nr:hypothetical protein K432DRAFT_408240 [Lepidopterella palustris CBS 459.81]